MGKNRNWTKEEVTYLRDKWGSVSINTIMTHTGRSFNAITNKVRRLGLPPFLECGDYITVNVLCKTIFGHNFDSYKLTSWVKNRKFPLRTVVRGNCRIKVVYIDDFWKWAEKNQNFLDFSNFEKYTLGCEPEWVQKKRVQDMKRYKTTKWTSTEDFQLKILVKKQQYDYQTIANMLNRSCGAIQRRLSDLGIKDRPVRKPNHSPWTDNDKQQVIECILNGGNYQECSERIGRSEKAIRGRMYDWYGSENLDKIRKTLKGR